MNDKLQIIRKKMEIANLQGLLITNTQNIYYLTNINCEGSLIITKKGNFLLTDARYIEVAKQTLTIDDEITVLDKKSYDTESLKNFFENCTNVGFEDDFVSYKRYEEYKQIYNINNFVKTDYLVEKQRVIKDKNEIENIKLACKITDQCFSYLLNNIKIGMTEKQISKMILNYFYDNSDGLAFDSIVASGKNTSKPHAIPTDKKIEFGDIITIDMGCKINGYCSDMTRTFFVGSVDKTYEIVYNIVKRAQENSILDIKDNANIRNISQKVENAFNKEGFAQSHSLGHGVGLDVHEMPILSNNSNSILKENMIITSEPGIYLQGSFGIRIEDTILVTKDGSNILTKSPKDIIII